MYGYVIPVPTVSRTKLIPIIIVGEDYFHANAT